MQLRVLQATLMTVLLAVLLLGIPLGAAWLTAVRDNLSAQAGTLLQDVISETDHRLNEGLPIDETMLQETVDQVVNLDVQIAVTYQNTELEAGEDAGADALQQSAQGVNGQIVTVRIPQSDVRAHTASAWVLIIVAAISAIAIGVSVALWQAQRLSAPLVRLTRRAEELGSGRSRSEWKPSGIAEIDTVAVELTRSGAMLTERLEAESALASDASHQLRTPLTALSMRLDEILATSSEEWVREEARVSLEQVDRLTQVVHDLINAPRSSQRRTPGVVDLRQVLVQQAEEWKHAFRGAGRELRIQVPHAAAVWASHGPLTQVIATLIENSLAHGGGTTRVKVRRNEQSTVIEVVDEGAGIDPALGQRIFERSVSGKDSRGTGVGLALARTLVEDDGGRLELIDERPARFGIFLSTAPAPEDPELADTEDEQPSDPTKAHGLVGRRDKRRAERHQREAAASAAHALEALPTDARSTQRAGDASADGALH